MNILLKATAAITNQWLWAVVLVTAAFPLQAHDTPFLEKPVTIEASNQPVEEIFKTLNSQTGVVFSYNSQQFDDKQKVSLSLHNKPLRIVLDALLKPLFCTYTLKKKYIIIKYVGQAAPPKKSTFIISGYLVSAQDSTRIKDASIFVKTTRQSANTDTFGHFRLVASQAEAPLQVSIAKENFNDTQLVVAAHEDRELWIYLMPVERPEPGITLPDVVEAPVDTVPHVAPTDTAAADTTPPVSKFWERQRRMNANLRNITDTLFTKASFSLVPAISTNKLLSYNTVNKFSFNLLIGKSRGIDGFEIGGLINYDYGDVQYAQVAGVGNIVAGDVKYAQAGGLFNSVLGNMEGAQAGGLFNIVSGGMQGAQMGGIFNITKKEIKGVQAGGLFNHAPIVNGVQAGGLFNNASVVDGVQVGGIGNYANRVQGVQIGGVGNFTRDTVQSAQVGGFLNVAKVVQGIQVAGAINIAKEVDGVQIAGLVNCARVIRGVQIGCFNIADTCRGLPIGIFSYVRKGYHKIELSYDELNLATFGLRSGVNKFHNIFFTGYNWQSAQKFWTYGYGIGFYGKFTGRKGIVIDLTTQQLQNVNPGRIELNLLNRLNVSYSYAVAKKFEIALGPTANFFIQEKNDNSFVNTFNSIAPATFSPGNAGSIQTFVWVGGKVSVKFL